MSDRLVDKIGHFVSFPDSVIELWPVLGDDAILVFLYLRYRTNRETEVAYPSYKTIQKDTGLHPRRISNGISVLEKAGLLEKTKRFGGSTVYELKMPSTSKVEVLDEEKPQYFQGGSAVLPTVEEKLDRVVLDTSTNVEEQSSDDSPFYAVAGVIFKFAKDEIPKTSRQLVARAMNALQEAHPDVGAEDIKAFAGWWDSEKDGIALPRDPAKLQAHYLEYRNRHLMNEGATGEDGAVEMGGWA